MEKIDKVSDISDIKEQNTEIENYKKIRPEGKITSEESRSFLDNLFENNTIPKENKLNNDMEKNNEEIKEKKGGSYREVYKKGEGDKYEVNHIPPDSVTKLDRNDGPAIKMDKGDHRMTASCGSSREAIKYRKIQKELIEAGKFDEAVQMDIDDIREKFGNKYDEAIEEMKVHIERLKMEGKING